VQPDSLNKLSGIWAFPKISGVMKSSRVNYKRKFSLDIAQSQIIQDPIFGTSGGGEVLISDMLGNEQYYFLVYNNAQTRSEFWDGFNLAVTRVDLTRRLNFATGLYRLAGLYYNNYEGYFFERRYGGFATVSYPLNKFERLGTSVNIRYSDKNWYSFGQRRKAFLLSNFVSYTHDNSLWGPTGPLDGNRLQITLGNTVDIHHSNVNFTTVMLDVRKYFRLSYRICHAIRVWGQFNQGKEPLPFVMGGSWDLRGYKLWSLWGTKLALISNELRFPFIDQFYMHFPFGGIGLNSIRGALFVDAGNVWDDHFDEIKGSLGFGIRFTLGGYLALRFDIGKKTNFKKIYPKTFTQFFFGWDF
jgi:outer membrane protein assembly factor BamA